MIATQLAIVTAMVALPIVPPPVHAPGGAYPLEGAHTGLACVKCHRQAAEARFDDFALIKVVVETCMACHVPIGAPHEMPDRPCHRCHDVQGRTRFDHGGEPRPAPASQPAAPVTRVEGFPLAGRHAAIECRGCHKAGFTGLDAGCTSCHADPHDGALGAKCASCHDAAQPFTETSFDAARHRGAYPLVGRHAELACDTCHAGGRYTGLGTACSSCHADLDRHAGRFGTKCERCHRPTGWTPPRAFDHAETGFELAGVHAIAGCDPCHTTPKVGPPTGECVQCHADPHRGGAGLVCADCHRADTWLITFFEHDFTGFALNGRHLAVPCRDCHARDRFVGQPDTCLSCHGGDLPRAHTFPGARLCEDCHDSRSFQRVDFAHDRPDVALGVHARVATACGRCHRDARRLDADECAACHLADLPRDHTGFLRDLGGRDCTICHTALGPWVATTRFEHPTAITGAHVGLPCSSCHPVPTAIRAGARVCLDCHRDDEPRGDHIRNVDCVDCHAPRSFYPALTR